MVLAPFRTDVVGHGSRAREHLAVGRGHGCSEDGGQDEPGPEGAKHFHGEGRQPKLSVKSVLCEHDAAGPSNDQHEGNERGLPDKEPHHRLLAFLVGPERHHARNHLRLPCNTEPAEEEGEDPQAHAQRQVGRYKSGEHWVFSGEFGVQATKSADLAKRHPAEHDGPNDHHA